MGVQDLIKAVPVNVSRRGFLGGTGALVLAVALPVKPVRGQEPAGPAVQAFMELRPDGTVLLRSPFIEGGQGVYTAMAQIVGEELDVAPDRFTVEIAPPGGAFAVMGGFRITGGSLSTRTAYDLMRRLGASARAMLVQAASAQTGVAVADLTTEDGVVVTPTGQRLAYGDLAGAAMDLPVPAEVALRDPSEFRYIKTAVPRLDVRAKSTGQARYALDVQVDGMLSAAVRHAPRLGMTPKAVTNQAEVEAMRGVHSVHMLGGAVAVVAERFWQARAAEAVLEVEWAEGTGSWPMPAEFSSQGFRDQLAGTTGDLVSVEATGDAAAALGAAAQVIEATYDAPFVVHGQLEPPSATARFNADGTLDLWLPNQAPEMFVGAAAAVAGITPDKVRLHSQVLGGFFGRHFLYESANPFPQAIQLAKAVGRPVKLIWTREEEFLRDAPRPLGVARFRGAVGAKGPEVLAIEVIGEGPMGRWFKSPPGEDGSAHEGLSGKVYGIPNVAVGQVFVPNPAVIGFWRSVGHSMHDFMYESFLDEMAAAAGLDPYAMRLDLLAGSERHRTLLQAVGDLSGGWVAEPYEVDGGMRARGVAMASPFGSEVATIAEVSIDGGEVKVHQIWTAIDPGQIVNPGVIEAQVQSATALGVSQTLVEELVYEGGEPQARNFDAYPILRPDQMPEVHVRIIESGAAMGGVGEPGLPAVGPAICNAVARLTGVRVRSLPLAKHSFG